MATRTGAGVRWSAPAPRRSCWRDTDDYVHPDGVGHSDGPLSEVER